MFCATPSPLATPLADALKTLTEQKHSLLEHLRNGPAPFVFPVAQQSQPCWKPLHPPVDWHVFACNEHKCGAVVPANQQAFHGCPECPDPQEEPSVWRPGTVAQIREWAFANGVSATMVKDMRKSVEASLGTRGNVVLCIPLDMAILLYQLVEDSIMSISPYLEQGGQHMFLVLESDSADLATTLHASLETGSGASELAEIIGSGENNDVLHHVGNATELYADLKARGFSTSGRPFVGQARLMRVLVSSGSSYAIPLSCSEGTTLLGMGCDPSMFTPFVDGESGYLIIEPQHFERPQWEIEGHWNASRVNLKADRFVYELAVAMHLRAAADTVYEVKVLKRQFF
jgi:hypothetical protein